jgi:hypothetical protein
MSKVVAAPTPTPKFDATKFVRKGLDAEQVIKLKEVFDVFDADGSGLITTE